MNSSLEWRRNKVQELQVLRIVADANHLRDLKLQIDGRKPQGFIEL